VFLVGQGFHRSIDFMFIMGSGKRCLVSSASVQLICKSWQVVFFGSLPMSKFVVQFGRECGDVFEEPSSPAFKVGCLTQRAADLGYAARFLGFFVALGFSRFDGESTLPPQVANANR